MSNYKPGENDLNEFATLADPAIGAHAEALQFEVTMIARRPGIAVDPELISAHLASAAPNSLRALKADITAFDAWCYARGDVCLPASPQLVASFLRSRADIGAAPASLARYKASIAKLHRLCRLTDPCQDELVKLSLAAHRRKHGGAQKQARALRFKGAVKDPVTDAPRGINLRATLEACGDTLPELRDRALLSVAYDTGLRSSELVAISVADIFEAIDPDARLVKIARSKNDPEGNGATAFISPRSVTALTRWLEQASITEGPVFRRVIVRRYAACKQRSKVNPNSRGWNARWDPTWFTGKDAAPARIAYTVGEKGLHSGSVTAIFRTMLRRAFNAGAFGDLDAAVFDEQVKQISAHSTRIGINQDYFAVGESLAGIMDALRWKSPRMPLAYNRNLAAEQGAAGRLLGRLA